MQDSDTGQTDGGKANETAQTPQDGQAPQGNAGGEAPGETSQQDDQDGRWDDDGGKPPAAPPAATDGSDAEPAGDGRAPLADASTGAPPAAPEPQPADEEAAAEVDERLAHVVPAFTLQRALVCAIQAARTAVRLAIDGPHWEDAVNTHVEAMEDVFAYACETDFELPIETYYRYAAERIASLPAWEDAAKDFVLGLRVMIGAGSGLVEIADQQLAEFMEARMRLAGDDRQSAMRQAIAGRRAKRAERRARRPQAVAAYLNQLAENQSEAAPGDGDDAGDVEAPRPVEAVRTRTKGKPQKPGKGPAKKGSKAR